VSMQDVLAWEQVIAFARQPITRCRRTGYTLRWPLADHVRLAAQRRS